MREDDLRGDLDKVDAQVLQQQTEFHESKVKLEDALHRCQQSSEQ